MSKPRIKVCGITSVEDAVAVSDAGADAIGLVFYRQSPRAVEVSQAREICAALGPFTTVVGLFVDADDIFINRVLEEVPLHVLQFHGNENAEFCCQFNYPWIKAVRMKENLDLAAVQSEYQRAAAILVDSYKPGVPGGTGEVFDWQRLPANFTKPLILAGGLNSENVVDAIQQVKPYAVDVSGGVESSPGKKDLLKVKSFITSVSEAVTK